MFNRRQFLAASPALGVALLVVHSRVQGVENDAAPDKLALDFLKTMLSSPSPSGYEQPVQKLWADYTKRYAEIRNDVHGNTIGVLNPEGKPRLMFAGHCDEIGFMVTYIDDDGFLYFNQIGGFDQSIIPGRRVTIHASGGPITGVIGKGPIHLMSSEDRDRPSQIKDLCIDIGAKDKKESEFLITIGDPVTYTYEFLELRNGLAAARGFDDRIGSFIVAEVLRKLKGSKKLKAAVHGVSTVQEEVGMRGAITSTFGINPDVGIAIDVTHATDYPGVDKKQVGDIKLGGGGAIARGPYLNPRVYDLLVATARQNNIPFQIEGNPSSTGTDANAIQVTRAGVAAGLVSIPLRYMHTPVETLALADVKHIIDLLAGFAEALTPEMNFRP